MTSRELENHLDDLFKSYHLPRATYRVQFDPDLTFHEARELVEYLDKLGISDLYTSPLYKPRTGSTHGYDTVDYNEFNPALGSADDFEALVNELQNHDMGLLLDIVPNHMGIGRDNRWWMDVLKHGPSSVYSGYFDIDWQPKNRAIDNKVLLPVLGDHYGRVLENGELQIVYWHGDFYLHYYENQYPITPDTYADILEEAYKHLMEHYENQYVEDELLSIITALHHLPPYHTRDRSQLVEMRREQKVARRRFVALHDTSEEFRTSLQAGLERINGTVSDPKSFDLLDDILERQAYRLSYWRVASDEINYRRFFNINDMAAIRIEHTEVFMATHRLTFELLGAGKIRGLRIDHPDGLWNPKFYLEQLQEEYLVAKLKHLLPDEMIDRDAIRERLAQLAYPADRPSKWPLYVLVEKILSETEPLPYQWAVYGTTGYDFMTTVTHLFVDETHEAAFDDIYHGFIGEIIDYDALINQCKRLIMSDALNSELYARSSQLADIVDQNRRYRGFTRHNLEKALAAMTAVLPIYRTYITNDEPITERDQHYVDEATAIAKARNPRLQAYIFDFVRDALLLNLLDEFDESQHAGLREFVMQYQQMTGPVMAKSVEDTAFYIYNRLTALNEVGGHPNIFGISVDEFHQHNIEKAYPHTMLSSATHDTKRSEDVRARLNVLSEIPDEWSSAIDNWSQINASAKTTLADGTSAPSRNDEYLLYQTLVGAYPLEPSEDFTERIANYMHKAINEAKVHSDWVYPNDAYQQATRDFITHILADDTFMTAFEPFQQQISFFGFVNSLAQTLLKITVPGMPDIYQGNELWRYSLVDPDNRRPVDYAHRRQLLDELYQRQADDLPALLTDLTTQPENGAIKLFTTALALNFRREHEALFTDGTYQAVHSTGTKANHVCAFIREHEGLQILVVVPRLIVGLTDGQPIMPLGTEIWGDTAIELETSATYRDVFTNETLSSMQIGSTLQLSIHEILNRFPVALLIQEG